MMIDTSLSSTDSTTFESVAMVRVACPMIVVTLLLFEALKLSVSIEFGLKKYWTAIEVQ